MSDNPMQGARDRLVKLEAEFDAAGGRGVELADEIDGLRRMTTPGTPFYGYPPDIIDMLWNRVAEHDADEHTTTWDNCPRCWGDTPLADALVETFSFGAEGGDLLPGERHFTIEELAALPAPVGSVYR